MSDVDAQRGLAGGAYGQYAELAADKLELCFIVTIMEHNCFVRGCHGACAARSLPGLMRLLLCEVF